jgi:hypothetical protein
MMPHLGVLAQVHPRASLEVFERDCLIYLGTCVAPKGDGKIGRPCFRFTIRGEGVNESGEMAYGDIRLIPGGAGGSLRVTIEPERAFDVGEGPGKRAERDVRGGAIGIMLDARGRPLVVPGDRITGRPAVARWVKALDVYPGLPAAPVRV